MAAEQHTAPNPYRGTDLLSPIEPPLNELRTRLEFLVGFFEPLAAEMDNTVLHLMLSDCLAAAMQARELWQDGWDRALMRELRS